MSAPAGPQYYVRLGTQLIGPMTLEQLVHLRNVGRLQPFHSISTDGKTWQPASSLNELFPIQTAPATPPGAPQGTSSSVPSAVQDLWYYLDKNNNQLGPIPHTELVRLYHAQEINKDTLVWKPGLQNWERLELAIPELHAEISPKRKNRKFRSPKKAVVIAIAGGIVFLSSLLGLAWWLWRPLQLDAESIFHSSYKSVPLLIGEDAHGSGFIIEITRKKSKRWFIVTNKHVIEELQEAMGEQKEPTLPYRPKWKVIFFVKPDGRTLYVSPSDELFVRYIHRDADVALIECTGLINQLEDRGIRPLRLAPREHIVRPGMELVVIGHPGLADIDKPVPMTYTKGQIAGPEREINGLRYYQLQVPAAPGNSGGPVLDMTGQVIAIVTMRVRDNNQGQFNFALHLKYLYQLLDEVP